MEFSAAQLVPDAGKGDLDSHAEVRPLEEKGSNPPQPGTPQPIPRHSLRA